MHTGRNKLPVTEKNNLSHNRSQSLLARLQRLVALIEDSVLVLLLSAMLGLAGLQIILRNVFHSGIVEGEPLLRVLVLWIGLLGAVVACRHNRHITIDLLTRHFSDFINSIIKIIIYAFVSFICAVLAFHAVKLVMLDYESATIAFSDIPAWWVELILPFAFSMIALRYLFGCLGNIKSLWNKS